MNTKINQVNIAEPEHIKQVYIDLTNLEEEVKQGLTPQKFLDVARYMVKSSSPFPVRGDILGFYESIRRDIASLNALKNK